ncbi:G/U mismatch-specific DNA glycosylase [Marmoricola endophyticus]|uniref:G/U mismatch-specific DNA glycosylase n=1 Tax=Marmoricola endophyticus TaxID=2040280 RepID=A0A917BSN7_9ACTN|nr:G/U mismatch-specific DNA glycosylase [Marmoricola endophyticus]
MLPDVVGPRPRVVFCGMAGAQSTRSREHYYEGPGNSFWESLHRSGLVPQPLEPTDDERLPAFGLGLTDLVRHRDPDRFEVDELAAKVRAWEPEWLAVTSKTVAAALARHLGEPRPSYGVSSLALGGAPVFVLPGPSGANRRHDYDGRPTRLAWWQDLAALVEDPHAGER